MTPNRRLDPALSKQGLAAAVAARLILFGWVLALSAPALPARGEHRALKFTYIGVQKEPIPSLILHDGVAFDLFAMFESVESALVDRGNDGLASPEGERIARVVQIPAGVMEEALRIVRAMARDADVPELARWSLAVTTLAVNGQVNGEEWFWGAPRAGRVLAVLEQALAASGEAASAVGQMRGAICGVNDRDADNVPNLCDACPTLPGPENSAGCPCAGDCNLDGAVTVAEIVRGVNVILGRAEFTNCQALDRNADLVVTVEELVAAVRALLRGCGE
ncbi:MAG: hypothetical protein KatS3mg077_2010 [Candidatus Binatia bacterium]|nr:MAG: hypothetical protein KatS3mg077_2010 [Candidatus Binatia bacterium]